MKLSLSFIALLLLSASAFVSAQASHHGFSLRLGGKYIKAYDLVEPDPEIASLLVLEDVALGASLRYNYFFGERFGIYAGFGVTKVSSQLLFQVASETVNGPRLSRSGPGVGQFFSHAELGFSYAQRLGHRLSLVGEVGAQLVNVKWGGGSGRTSVFEGGNPDPLFSLEYSYLENPDQKPGLALQFSPGLRYQLNDHLYLTLRGDFIFSDVNLLEAGQFEATSNLLSKESTIGSFERKYGAAGIDLMVSYRF